MDAKPMSSFTLLVDWGNSGFVDKVRRLAFVLEDTLCWFLAFAALLLELHVWAGQSSCCAWRWCWRCWLLCSNWPWLFCDWDILKAAEPFGKFLAIRPKISYIGINTIVELWIKPSLNFSPPFFFTLCSDDCFTYIMVSLQPNNLRALLYREGAYVLKISSLVEWFQQYCWMLD